MAGPKEKWNNQNYDDCEDHLSFVTVFKFTNCWHRDIEELRNTDTVWKILSVMEVGLRQAQQYDLSILRVKNRSENGAVSFHSHDIGVLLILSEYIEEGCQVCGCFSSPAELFSMHLAMYMPPGKL